MTARVVPGLFLSGGSMKKRTAALFDFDGTLMDTNQLIIHSWQHTFRTLEGRERPVEEILKTLGEPLRLSMERLLPDADAEEAVEIYRSYQHGSFADEIRLFPRAGELIRILADRGIRMGIVTSRMMGTTLQGLDKFGLREYFSAIITCDHTRRHKPDPEPARLALEQLAVGPEESLMVGDTEFDIRCAQNAGILPVLVDWSLTIGEEERRLRYGSVQVIRQPEDLIRLLGE